MRLAAFAVMLFLSATVSEAAAPPPVTRTFDALDDNGTFIPPDVAGAVGPDHLMIVLNSQLRIQDKLGNTVSTSTLATFFSSLAHTGSHANPQVVYDALHSRWLVIDAADATLTTAAVEVAASQTSDPTQGWWFFNVPVTGTNYADHPNVGFNKDWVVIASNLFSNSTNIWQGAHVDVLNRLTLYAGTNTTFTRFTTTTAQTHFAMVPALEYDATASTLYLLEEWSGASAQVRIDTISGAVGAETFTAGSIITLAQGSWADMASTTNFAPQLGIANKIYESDDRMRSAVYRNGHLWGAFTVFLPTTAPTRTALQWFSLDPASGTLAQSGRLDDTTGSVFYAFPSLAVNRYNDMLLGYSRFSAATHPSAGYTMQLHFDDAGTLRDDTIYKAGSTTYFKDFGSGTNQWGDYSSTAVDPGDDVTLWTVQEYAASPANTWGTWWAELDLACVGVADGAACDTDGLCSSGSKTCASGVCSGATPTCAAAAVCRSLSCDPFTGTCSYPNTSGGICNDGNACTSADTCDAGACTGVSFSCPAPTACQAAVACDGDGGCVVSTKPNGTACDDGNACTRSDVCTSGTCGGTAFTCPAPTQCQAAVSCAGDGSCNVTPQTDGTLCNDGNACTRSDSCTAGVCGGTTYTCPPPSECQLTNVCNGVGGCVSMPAVDGTVCSSGTCLGGTCTGAVVDAGSGDAGVADGGVADAGVADAGVADAGVMDGGSVDAGSGDGGFVDAGVLDAGFADAGPLDSGVASIDAGFDAGTLDSGVVTADAGVDAGAESPDGGMISVGAPAGCGCGSSDGPALLALAGIALMRRRRPRP